MSQVRTPERRRTAVADRRPQLILVSGAPASGKSTLAGQLAADLGLPMLAKDLIKEALFDALGTPDLEGSRHLSVASYKVLYAVLDRLIDGGAGVVVDCNFHRGHSEGQLRPLIGKSTAVLLHCRTSYLEMTRRYERRVVLRERHPGHHDATFSQGLLATFESGEYDPLDLDLPTMIVDTTEGYSPDLDAIRAFVDAATWSATAPRSIG